MGAGDNGPLHPGKGGHGRGRFGHEDRTDFYGECHRKVVRLDDSWEFPGLRPGGGAPLYVVAVLPRRGHSRSHRSLALEPRVQA